MNVTQLRAFVTVVDTRSFSEAARQMGVSQPAVTMQVRALETDLGTPLLDRSYRRVDLTEAGRSLLPHARRVLAEMESARVEIEELSATISGHLIIAASTVPGVYVVPRILGGFLAEYPDVTVTLTVADSAEVVDAVESGAAHVGLTGAIARGAKASFLEAGGDELVLIAPPAHRLVGTEAVDVTDLSDEVWVARESGSGTRQMAERLLAERGLEPAELNVAVELGTGEAVVSAVEGGLGVAIVSRFVAAKAIELGTIAEIIVSGLPVSRPFYLATGRTSTSRAGAAFVEYFLATADRR